jgi:D-serine deaminase-like pyridoxal phosphate-dependent protein
MKKYTECTFSCISDSRNIIEELSYKAVESGMDCRVWLDINAGMNRTGITAGQEAIELYKTISSLPGLIAEGLHVYDGHSRESDFELRKKLCDEDFRPVELMVEKLHDEGFTNIKIIAGGTPSFPVHALRRDVQLSPGTSLLWDWGYGIKFPDMGFIHAAAILTRVISKPGSDLLCIDLGHKAVASEMPHPRIVFPEISEFTVTVHSEEHMVIKTPAAAGYKTGDIIYCIPWHICPTTDRHDTVSVVSDGKVTAVWNVEARKRRISC